MTFCSPVLGSSFASLMFLTMSVMLLIVPFLDQRNLGPSVSIHDGEFF